MARNRKIDINDQAGNTLASFNPPDLQAQPGDLIFWLNNSSVAHWPAPTADPKDQKKWLPYQIPGRTANQDPAASQSITFASDVTIDYVCSLHHGEKGRITVKTVK
jgi:plastocyanin